MSETTLISGGTVVTADDEFPGDVLIEGETIAAVGHVSPPEGATVIDASAGAIVLPGLIDNHTHLSMPFMGMMSVDDYDTGHAGRGRRRRHLPGRLRDPARARQSALGAGAMVALAPRARRTSTTASTWR